MTPSSTTEGTLPSRSDIDERSKWRLEDLYRDDAAWETDVASLEASVASVAAYQGTLGQSGERLLSWLRLSDDLGVLAGKLGNYAFRRFDEDTGNTTYQGMMGRMMSLHTRLGAAMSWVEPELLSIPTERIEAFIRETEGLAMYGHALDEVLRMKEHTLSIKEERLLALSQEATSGPSNIFDMFNDADLRFGTIRNEDGEDVELTKGRYITFQESRDRSLREQSFAQFYEAYGSWKNTLAATFSSHVKRQMFYARARGYENTREAALHPNSIPTTVYDNVVSTINDNLGPLHRSMELRRKLLDVDVLKPWDLYVPLSGNADREFPYEEAQGLVTDAMKVLGDEYVRDMSVGFNEGWIDVYENQGKASGAYSAWTWGAHPFILLNYTNTLKDVFTLAHELGHSMHSYYTWRRQPPVYGGYTIFCAEVASTCNEMLLMDHMLHTVDDTDVRLQLLFHHIDSIRGTVYNQALFAEFEQWAHETAEAGTTLTVDLLNERMTQLYSRYYGPAFQSDERYAINWARIPHFYRSFYVYQYATGLSAAAALSARILAREDGALERYLAFLSAGSSRYSIDLLADAGVDMRTPAPVLATADLMTTLLDEVERLL